MSKSLTWWNRDKVKGWVCEIGLICFSALVGAGLIAFVVMLLWTLFILFTLSRPA